MTEDRREAPRAVVDLDALLLDAKLSVPRLSPQVW